MLQRINQVVFKIRREVMANIIRITEHIHAKTSKTDPALASRQLLVIRRPRTAGLLPGLRWQCLAHVQLHRECGHVRLAPIPRTGPRGGTDVRLVSAHADRSARAALCTRRFPASTTRPGVSSDFQEVLQRPICQPREGSQGGDRFRVGERGDLQRPVRPGETGRSSRSASPTTTPRSTTSCSTRDTGQGVCVIDLDTVMPGLSVLRLRRPGPHRDLSGRRG